MNIKCLANGVGPYMFWQSLYGYIHGDSQKYLHISEPQARDKIEAMVTNKPSKINPVQ